jgi:hypothetical protein
VYKDDNADMLLSVNGFTDQCTLYCDIRATIAVLSVSIDLGRNAPPPPLLADQEPSGVTRLPKITADGSVLLPMVSNLVRI